jgi:peroxiredoxin
MEHEKQPAQGTRLPAVPLTLDGSYILHQMFRVRWSAWRALGASDQKHILDRSTAMFVGMEKNQAEPSALFSLLGHKGDLMVDHFRRTIDDLNHAPDSYTHQTLPTI